MQESRRIVPHHPLHGPAAQQAGTVEKDDRVREICHGAPPTSPGPGHFSMVVILRTDFE
jgi:hypothetical protein